MSDDDGTSHLAELSYWSAHEFGCNRQSLFFRGLHSFAKGLIFDSNLFGEIKYVFYRAICIQKNTGISFVSPLLRFCRPSDIGRLIVSICVYSINRVLGTRRPSYIFKKAFKFAPSFAKTNAPCAVIAISAAPFIKASLSNSMPNSILHSWISASGFSMRGEHSSKVFATMRSTADSFSKIKVSCYCRSLLSTITNAVPRPLFNPMIINRASKADNEQLSKSFSHQTWPHKQLLIEVV